MAATVAMSDAFAAEMLETTSRDTVATIGAKVVADPGYAAFEMVEVAVSRDLFHSIVTSVTTN